jgi:tRNA G18 (ribose-2'-O)-methylase SpoU
VTIGRERARQGMRRPQRIDSADDPRIAPYRDVPEPELVRARGLFIAEGRIVVRRVLEHGRYRVRSLLVDDAALRDLAPALERSGDDVSVYVCAPAAFRAITGHDIHRGCLALVERPPAADVGALLADARTLLVLDAVANADNVGGAFRNAAALGADAVLLSPTCCDPLYRKAIRTSMAAVLRVPFARAAAWPDGLRLVRAAGFTIVALTPREPSESLDAFVRRDASERTAMVVGAEGAGLTPEVEALADHRVRIPIAADVDSLNVAVAVGIALYALSKRQPRADFDAPRRGR